MTKRCLEPNCTILTSGSRCPTHKAALRQRRGGSGWTEQRHRAQTIATHGLTCAICGVTCTLTRGPRQAEQDHTIPVAHGGDSRPSNRRVLCRTCNRSKGGK